MADKTEGLKLPGKFDLGITGTFPGETALAAFFNYLAVSRQTMSQANRDEADRQALAVSGAFWRTLGVIE